MIGLLQRVSEARVVVEGHTVGSIGAGLLVLLCAERGDTETQAASLMTKLLGYRVFNDAPQADARGRMNRSLMDVKGDLLLVPQFTLAADTRSGTRPSFTPAADPETGRRLFDHAVSLARQRVERVGTGVFGADMKVHLVNDGPVTFWLQISPKAAAATAV